MLSFTELPLNGVVADNKIMPNNSWQHLPTSDHLFDPNADINRLKETIESFLSFTRNSLSNKSAKLDVQQRIVNVFKENYLLTSTQHFMAYSEESAQHLEGLNIIGIYPGLYRSKGLDKVLLIGAHYDTVDRTGGVNDNGSGVSALLEIIRLISSNNCRLTYSVMFAAFDLEEYGALGSKAFVNQYLIPNEIISNKSQFEGAIILDTILNFNHTFGSQDIPYDIHRALPEWSKEMKENRFTGDFLALIYRQNIDHRLQNTIKTFWKSKSKQTTNYKLSELSIKSLNSTLPDLKTLTNHANLLRSDHIMFWYHNNPLYNQTLKAILLTDTGPFRGYMRDCYHTFCDNTTHLNHNNLMFLKQTVQVLAQSAVQLSEGKCNNT